MEDIRTTLNERNKTHGDFAESAKACMQIREVLRRGPSWHSMTYVEQDAADMIAQKLARAVSGDPHELDHWRDITGYAQLIVDDIGRMPKLQED